MILSLKVKLRKLEVKDFNRLMSMCKSAKNLYNQALYVLNQEYKQNQKYLGYNALDKIMKEKENLEGQINYKLLKAGVSQQILRKLDKNYASFFSLIKKHKSENGKNRPNPPKYIKEKFYNLTYDSQRFQIKGFKIILEKDLSINLPFILKDKKIKQIDIIPHSSFFEVVFVYEDEVEYEQVESNDNIVAIDLGLNNLATCVSNGVIRPFILNGRVLKSINQYYNKRMASIKSVLMKRNGKYWSKKLDDLTLKRKRKIIDYLHKCSSKIEGICVEKGISKVVIGNVAGSNYKINLGSRTNQNFVNISLGQFVEKLRYKLERHGIVVVVREESYTSKASFIDCDLMPIDYKSGSGYEFSGRRISRGMYRSREGILLNADVNGAYNILRKESPKFSYSLLDKSDGVEGLLIPYKLAV